MKKSESSTLTLHHPSNSLVGKLGGDRILEVTSVAYVSKSNAVAERNLRSVLEGTRVTLSKQDFITPIGVSRLHCVSWQQRTRPCVGRCPLHPAACVAKVAVVSVFNRSASYAWPHGTISVTDGELVVFFPSRAAFLFFVSVLLSPPSLSLLAALRHLFLLPPCWSALVSLRH